MIRLFLLLFITFFPVSLQAISPKEFLDAYFQGGAYETVDTSKLVPWPSSSSLVVEVPSTREKGISRAVVFRAEKEGLEINLQIVGPGLFDGHGMLIGDASNVAGGFGGWRLTLPLRGSRLNLDCLTHQGSGVTDFPSVLWDSKEKRFRLASFDRSQF